MAKGNRGGKYKSSKPSRGQLEYYGEWYGISTIRDDLGTDDIKEVENTFYSIQGYTGSDYIGIRDNNPDYKEQADYIERYIKKAPTYNGDIYRGIALDNETGKNYISQLQKGSQIDMLGISSWSSDKKVANNFSTFFTEDNDYKIVFHTKNKTGVGIAHLSKMPDQQEVLHSSNSRFKVIGVTNISGNSYEVELQEV